MEYGFVAVWWVGLLALLLVGAPVASALFSRLGDGAVALGIPVSLSVIFLTAFSVGRVSLDAAAWVGLAAVLATAFLARRRGVRVDAGAVRRVAIVFTVAFLFLVVVRAADPAIRPGGGEKFLDFGLLKASLRAGTLPPEDFWFANEPVRYYYGGHLVVAQLVRLTGTPPGVAYNLGLATFYATYVTAAYGLAGSIADRVRATASDRGFDRRAALLGAVFVGIASNLMTPLRALLIPLPAGLAESIGTTLGVWSGRVNDDGGLAREPTAFHFWDPTAIVDGVIHEFPLFAWINGDLHAHMMAPSFTLLLAATLLAYYRSPPIERRRRWGLLFGVVPLLGALLAVVHTWSFPATAGLTFLTVLLAPASASSLVPPTARERVAGLERSWPAVARFAVAGASAVAATLIAVLWSLPFWAGNAGGREVALLPDRSSLAALLVVHGTFLVPFAAYLGYLGWRRYDFSRTDLALDAGILAAVVAAAAVADVAVLGVAGPLLLGGYLLARPWIGYGSGSATPPDPDATAGDPSGAASSADGGTAPASTAATASNGGGDSPLGGRAALLAGRPGFEVVLLLAGAGLVFLVEFVYLRENAGPGRFNTVFKIYAQVWAFWAVAAAVAVGRLLQLGREELPSPGIAGWRPDLERSLRVGVVVLVAGASIYGVLAVGGHLGTGEYETLDGTVYVDEHHPNEAPAIDWLDRRSGTPTIVDAPGDWVGSDAGLASPYGWANGPSTFTGVPTVAGWAHERGYRSPEAYEARASDAVAVLTGSAGERADLLREYDVEYLYVGPNECRRYAYETTGSAPSGPCDRSQLPDYGSEPGISPVVEPSTHGGTVTIYRVDRDRLTG